MASTRLTSRPHLLACLALSAIACGGETITDTAGPRSGGSSDLVDCSQDFGDPATSRFVLPYREGHSYKIIQGYCPPNPTWGHHGWFAYDFGFPNQDTVFASREGRVWFVRENQPNIGGNCSGGKENTIFVIHDDGTVMNYVHLYPDGAFPERGDHVVAGEPIGLSGNSGCSSGPHLHVTLYRDSTDFNRPSSLPFNYRNAIGPLDSQRGLIQDQTYTAGPIG